MSGYTPTAIEVRVAWSEYRSFESGYPDAEFDRWLDAHDREVREQVAREIEAAGVRYSEDYDNGSDYAHAARIAVLWIPGQEEPTNPYEKEADHG